MELRDFQPHTFDHYAVVFNFWGPSPVKSAAKRRKSETLNVSQKNGAGGPVGKILRVTPAHARRHHPLDAFAYPRAAPALGGGH